jgi:hypothetical protein
MMPLLRPKAPVPSENVASAEEAPWVIGFVDPGIARVCASWAAFAGVTLIVSELGEGGLTALELPTRDSVVAAETVTAWSRTIETRKPIPSARM